MDRAGIYFEAIGMQVVAALKQMDVELEAGALLTVDPNRTRLRLSEMRENSGVLASEFEFAAPAGAEVVDLR